MACDTFPNVHAYYQNKATLPTLGLYDFGLVYPFKPLHVGLRVNFFGFDAYQEFSAQVMFAKFFKPYIAVGLQVGYQGIHQSPKQGYLHTGSVDIGLMAFPIKQLRIGFWVNNVSFSYFPMSVQEVPLPVIFKAGLGYHIAQKIWVTAQVEKALDQPFAYAIGLDYQIIKQLAVRTGLYICKELTPTLGMSLILGPFRCDVAFQYHFATGLNSSVGLVYQWNR